MCNMVEILALIMWFGTEHYKKSIYEICLNNYVHEVQELCEWLTVIETHENSIRFLKAEIRDWEDVHENTFHVHRLEERVEQLRVQLILSFYMLQK